jgi:hypothetical protein
LVIAERQGAVINTVRLYPNPVVNVTTLEIKTSEPELQIIITDMNGKTVYNKTVNSRSGAVKEQLDISHLSSGIYIATVAFGKTSRQSLKIIKL